MQRSGKLRSSRKPTLESLESRLPMAGNVTAIVVDGKLTVLGDAQANEIVIEELYVADDLSEFGGRGRFSIHGLAGTTINGSNEPFHNSEAASDVLVNLGRGDDRMVIAKTGTVPGLRPGDVFVTDPISSLINEGPVLVGSLVTANLIGQLKINLSDGNDLAIVQAAAAAGIIIDAGAGDDEFYLADDAKHATSTLLVRMGAGSDLASVTVFHADQQINLHTADGNDRVFVTLATPAQATVHTGRGDDDVRVARLEEGRASLTPSGDRQLVIRTGLGNDMIGVSRISAAELLINTGLGRDAVEVSSSGVTGDVTIHGGGQYGSSVKVSDRYTEPLGYTSTSPSAIRYSPVHIGGDLQIDFNVESTTPDQTHTQFSVIVGTYDLSPAVHDGLVVTGRLRVFGTVGDDMLSLANLTAGEIQLHGGNGRDIISADGVKTAGDVAAYLGNGDDHSVGIEDFQTLGGTLVPAAIGGNLIVDFGAGNERFGEVGFEPPILQKYRLGATHSGVASKMTVAGQLRFFGGSGTDELQIYALTMGSADLQFGPGASTLELRYSLVHGDARVAGSFDADRWFLSSFGVGGDLTLQTRAGANEIGINETSKLPSHVGRHLLFDLGEGRDLLRVGFDSSAGTWHNALRLANPPLAPLPGTTPGGGLLSVGGRLTLTGRGGNDNVLLDHLDVHARLFAFLGNGDDVLEMQNTTSAGGIVDGGLGGNDRLDGQHASTAGGGLLRTNWEVDNLLAEPVATILLPGVRRFGSR